MSISRQYRISQPAISLFLHQTFDAILAVMSAEFLVVSMHVVESQITKLLRPSSHQLCYLKPGHTYVEKPQQQQNMIKVPEITISKS